MPARGLAVGTRGTPGTTDKIDVELFARLDDLWNDHAPLPDFEATLEELVSAHAEVGRLFREQAL